MHVTKQEFVDRVAEKAGISKRDASEAVDAFLDSITDVLHSGGEVSFTDWWDRCLALDAELARMETDDAYPLGPDRARIIRWSTETHLAAWTGDRPQETDGRSIGG